MVSSNWDRVSLGDVCRVETGAGFPIVHQGLKDQEFPFFKVGDMNTAGNEKEMHVFKHSISEEMRKKLRAIAFPEGTIVFPKIGAAIATNKKRMLVKPSCVDNNVMALIPSENLDSSFLFYLLLNKDLSDFANTGNPPSIRQSNVEEWTIPQPPLTEQKRIAALLARADRLRQLRRTAHDLGDSLLQSVFLEMFGNSKTNPKKWDVEVIGEFINPTRQMNPQLLGRPDFWYVDITSIDRQSKTIVEPKLLKIEDAPSRARKHISANDILVSTVRPNLNAVAKVPKHLENQISSTGFCVLRPDTKKLNSEYLFAIVQSKYFVDHLVKNETGANYPAVSDGIILGTPIPVPPLSLQEEFASMVRRVEGLRGRQAESERQGEVLFRSLLGESFGE